MNTIEARISGFELIEQYKHDDPDALANEVKKAMNAGGVEWREPADAAGAGGQQGRWSNLDFLRNGKARSAWQDHWPVDGCRFSWDAIGRVQMGKVGWEWLLVAAFARPEELERGLEPPLDAADERIASAIDEAKGRYGVDPGVDWIAGNSHLATRLSALSFLRQHGVCSRMLCVYFHAGDSRGDDLVPSQDTWDVAIATAEQRLGLRGTSVLERRLYRMFLPR